MRGICGVKILREMLQEQVFVESKMTLKYQGRAEVLAELRVKLRSGKWVPVEMLEI